MTRLLIVKCCHGNNLLYFKQLLSEINFHPKGAASGDEGVLAQLAWRNEGDAIQ